MPQNIEIDGSFPPTLSRPTSGLSSDMISPGVLPRDMSVGYRVDSRGMMMKMVE